MSVVVGNVASRIVNVGRSLNQGPLEERLLSYRESTTTFKAVQITHFEETAHCQNFLKKESIDCCFVIFFYTKILEKRFTSLPLIFNFLINTFDKKQGKFSKTNQKI